MRRRMVVPIHADRDAVERTDDGHARRMQFTSPRSGMIRLLVKALQGRGSSLWGTARDGPFAFKYVVRCTKHLTLDSREQFARRTERAECRYDAQGTLGYVRPLTLWQS